MSSRFLYISQKICGFSNLSSSRNVIRMLGLPPEKARSLKKKIEDYSRVDPEVAKRIDIGLPGRKDKERSQALERSKILAQVKNDEKMEKLAREGKLEVSLDDVEKEWKQSQLACEQLKAIADHHGIFSHLFGDYAYFYPRVMMDIEFILEDESIVPVFRGNIVKPKEALKAPQVKFEADEGSLWTLILTNPDGHLTEENSEYVHWFIGNIPGNQISKGEVVYDYLPPFPPKGTGFQRFVFILYKQERKMDYSSLKKTSPCTDLTMRTFKTLDFYRTRQDELTPAGLSFCQTDYDLSVTDLFHNVLGMKEPRYEYDFKEHYVAPQRWFPKKRAFNVYLDLYRDPREINKEYIVDRLKKYDPFLKKPRKLKYPGAQPEYHHHAETMPSWLKRKTFFDDMGWGRINDTK